MKVVCQFKIDATPLKDGKGKNNYQRQMIKFSTENIVDLDCLDILDVEGEKFWY